jgi:ABC-type uncharacterized transport system ATPase subunit
MKLISLAIQNFRGLDHITVKFDELANVVVGPNAIGKTTILEAIRLLKGTLAPRIADETQQVFITLGAISPHNLQSLNYAALARDLSRSLNIKGIFELSGHELAQLDSLASDFATAIVRASLGPTASVQGQLALVQFLSSPAGLASLSTARTEVLTHLPRYSANCRGGTTRPEKKSKKDPPGGGRLAGPFLAKPGRE